MRKIVAALVLVLIASTLIMTIAPVSAKPNTVNVKVVDNVTGKPLADVYVYISSSYLDGTIRVPTESGTYVTTDSHGKASFSLPKDGTDYQTVNVYLSDVNRYATASQWELTYSGFLSNQDSARVTIAYTIY